MGKKQLSDEQKSKLRKFYGKIVLSSFFNGLKLGAIVFLSNIFIISIDHMFINNKWFVFCTSFFSAFLIFRSYRISSLKQHDMFKEEYKKILES
jgi:hypothetical protein